MWFIIRFIGSLTSLAKSVLRSTFHFLAFYPSRVCLYLSSVSLSECWLEISIWFVTDQETKGHILLIGRLMSHSSRHGVLAVIFSDWILCSKSSWSSSSSFFLDFLQYDLILTCMIGSEFGIKCKRWIRQSNSAKEFQVCRNGCRNEFLFQYSAKLKLNSA